MADVKTEILLYYSIRGAILRIWPNKWLSFVHVAQEKLIRCNKHITMTKKILNEATKPEVVITMRRYEIEMQFRCLDIGFRGRQSQWNIDRHEVLYSSAWILPIWMHGDHETGSSYNYASVRDRNTISVSRHRFSRTPKSMEHRPTWSSV